MSDLTTARRETEKAKHTPGPWEASGNGIFGISPLNARVRLADIIFHNRLNRIDSEANARLIAASPDLLEQLKIAKGHIEHMARFISSQNAGYSFESIGEDMPGIDAAIAKGEGR